MFGLLGLLGAVMAGYLVDAMTSQGHDEAHDDDPPDGPVETGTGDLLDDPAYANDPAAGMPVSDDMPDVPDPDQALHGSVGNDILASHDGDDTLVGADGNDQLGGYAGADDLAGGAGTDWLYGAEGADTLAGEAEADDLHGGAGADDLTGGAGNDSLSGDAGRDLLAGGAGDDLGIGGEGDDSLLGQAGDDALQGGTGADYLVGGSGADTLDGNDGNDTIWGDILGPQVARGGTIQAGAWTTGHDVPDVDFLNGGAGDDVLHTGVGSYASGGTGEDVFAVLDIGPGDAVAQIMDFNKDEDSLVLLYDASHHAAPEITISSDPGSPDAMVMLDGVPVAQVMGGAGLQAGDVVLQAA